MTILTSPCTIFYIRAASVSQISTWYHLLWSRCIVIVMHTNERWRPETQAHVETLVNSDLQIGMAKTRLTSWLSLNKAVFKKSCLVCSVAGWFCMLKAECDRNFRPKLSPICLKVCLPIKMQSVMENTHLEVLKVIKHSEFNKRNDGFDKIWIQKSQYSPS